MREPLSAELAREPFATLTREYRALTAGDMVDVHYLPEVGVTMSMNGEPVLAEPGHDLIDTMLRAWSEEDPISEKVRRLTLENPCRPLRRGGRLRPVASPAPPRPRRRRVRRAAGRSARRRTSSSRRPATTAGT